MQSGTVVKQDNWTRFMQLSSEARLRNQGFGGGVRKTNQLRKPATGRPVQQTPVMTAGYEMQRPEKLYNAAKPLSSGRILGGKFDAYA
jgi:hypothetical protein